MLAITKGRTTVICSYLEAERLPVGNGAKGMDLEGRVQLTSRPVSEQTSIPAKGGTRERGNEQTRKGGKEETSIAEDA
jgi:hypothetical protein